MALACSVTVSVWPWALDANHSDPLNGDSKSKSDDYRPKWSFLSPIRGDQKNRRRCFSGVHEAVGICFLPKVEVRDEVQDGVQKVGQE